MVSTLRRVALSIGALGLTGLTVIGGPAVFAKLTARPHTFTVSSVPATPVALVLGAQIYPDGTPSTYLKGRLDTAKRLYDAGKVRAILVSGDNSDRYYNEPDGMRNYLIRKGVPADKVIADYAGFDTYDSCARAKRVYGVRQMIIVSQGYHLPRAITLSGALGIDAVGVGDASVKDLFPQKHAQGELRESFANFKMEWDLLIKRSPQQDPFDGSLLAAAELRFRQ